MMKIKVSGKDYYIRINAIELNANNRFLKEFLAKIDEIQNLFPSSIIQFFNDKLVLDEEHLFNASYYVIKAHNLGRNIASSRNMELLLYLACNRQIKYSLYYFGINEEIIKKGILHYCIVYSLNKITEIENKILDELSSIPTKSKILEKSVEKFHTVKNFFKFSDNQLNVILNSYEINPKNKKLDLANIDIFYKSLNDLICEQMTLLCLEKT